MVTFFPFPVIQKCRNQQFFFNLKYNTFILQILMIVVFMYSMSCLRDTNKIKVELKHDSVTLQSMTDPVRLKLLPVFVLNV